MNSSKTTRRAFIRGASGAAIALPVSQFVAWNDKIYAQAAANAPRRMFTLYFPGGAFPEWWNYNGALRPFLTAGINPKITIIQNLSFPAATSTAVAGLNPHAQGVGPLFSGAPVPGPITKSKVSNGGATIDQIAAQQLNPPTAVKSMSVSLLAPSFGEVGMGVHEYVTSWRSPTLPVTPLYNPLQTFNQLFASLITDQEMKRQQQVLGKSLLDFTLESYRKYASETSPLGIDGSRLLRMHYEELRELETQALDASKVVQQCGIIPAKPQSAASYSYDDYARIFQLHLSIILAAMRCDLLRFGNISFSGAVSNMHIRQVSALYDNHNASHFSNSDQVRAQTYLNYVTFFMNHFSVLLQRMNAVVEGNGLTLLDNSCMLIATEMSRGYNHDFSSQTMAVAGGKGYFPGGVINANQRATNDVLLSCLRFAGVRNLGSIGTPGFNRGALFG